MFKSTMNIADFDPVLWAAMLEEEQRQEDHIELIASENYASPRVMEAQGTKLTNKYAEGYWRLSVRKPSLVQRMPTCSPTLDHKRMRRCFWRFCNPAILSWD
jgi:hypothetical protein